MALSIVGGPANIMDPLPLGTVWAPWEGFSMLETQPRRQGARDARAVANSRQVDWCETPEAHVFKADVPGLSKEDIKVNIVDGRTLEISGERKKEELQEGEIWHLCERPKGRVVRRFRLPENANTEEVKAHVQDGSLTVTIPKIQKPKHQIRQIEIA